MKKFILEKLDLVVSVIQEYKIKGAKPVEKVVESTYGSILAYNEICEKTKDTKHGADFWKILQRVALIVGITVGAIKIAGHVIDLLPDTSTDAIEINIVEKPEIKPATEEEQ